MSQSNLSLQKDSKLRIEISAKTLSKLLGSDQFCCTDIRCLDPSSKKQLWHLLLQNCACMTG
ncbi:MAG: hypothetical protein HRT35_10640 [Algicola sp.]|nr:hypothetical protein [Algicola sp.]